LAVYGDRSDHEANQGDIFRDVPLECSLAKASDVMVISHDCDCDKYLSPKTPLIETAKYEFRVTVAMVHPLSQLSGGRPKAVREDKMPRYLLLPAEGQCDKLVVDLWTEQPIRMCNLLKCSRRTSLSDEWRLKLWWKIIRLRLGSDYRAILTGELGK
jgi:hypothetical protein